MKKHTIQIWKKLKEEELNDYKFCRLYNCTFKHPVNSRVGDFIVADYSDSVQIIAETIDNKIILVEQFRFSSERVSLELPAGRLEHNESPIDGAIRELGEETGYVGESAKLLAVQYPNPAIIRNKSYVIFIKKCKKIHDTNFDPMEELITKLVNKTELSNLIKIGKLDNCVAISAIANFLLCH